MRFRSRFVGYSLASVGLLATLTYATQDTAAFLERGYGPDVAGMGFAYTAVSEDANAIYFNPAGLATGPQRQYSVFTFEAFEARTSGVQLKSRPPKTSQQKLGFGIGYVETTVNGLERTGFQDGRVTRTSDTFGFKGQAIYFSAGRPLTPVLSAGASIKTISERLDGAYGVGAGVDAGVLFRPSSQVQFGISALNIGGTTLEWSTHYNETIDPLIVGGVAARFWDQTVLASMDISSEWVRYGVRFSPIRFLDLSFGRDERHYSIGTQLHLGAVTLSFSFTQVENFSPIYRFGVGFSR